MLFSFFCYRPHRDLHSFPTRRSSDLVEPRADFGWPGHPPQGNGGLYSTAPEYARFCQMLLNDGTFKGRRFLSPVAMKFLTTPQDRKSTRLNSSHRCISYAVFCLKKKK